MQIIICSPVYTHVASTCKKQHRPTYKKWIYYVFVNRNKPLLYSLNLKVRLIYITWNSKYCHILHGSVKNPWRINLIYQISDIKLSNINSCHYKHLENRITIAFINIPYYIYTKLCIIMNSSFENYGRIRDAMNVIFMVHLSATFLSLFSTNK